MRPVRRAEQEAGEAPRTALRIGRPLRVVAIGGGTGLPSILAGLARLSRAPRGLPPLELTAVVAMSDDGGSSGRLKREQGVLPPGDIRNCLVALADPELAPLGSLFQFRFGRGEGLKGHAMGNLLLAAMSSLEGDFLSAVDRASRMLRCGGRVLPCTLDPVQLVGTLASGRHVVGESRIGRSRARLQRVELQPPRARPAPGVVEAIRAADLVVLGPGSLFSSVIPPLLVRGVAEALRESLALRVFMQNLMSQPGETDGLDAAGHIAALKAHAGEVVDVLLVDRLEQLPEAAERTYRAQGQRPVPFEARAVAAQGVLPVEAELLGSGRSVRHDPDKAAAARVGLLREAARARAGRGRGGAAAWSARAAAERTSGSAREAAGHVRHRGVRG